MTDSMAVDYLTGSKTQKTRLKWRRADEQSTVPIDAGRIHCFLVTNLRKLISQIDSCNLGSETWIYSENHCGLQYF